MACSAPLPDSADSRTSLQVSDEAVRRLAEAVARLNNDPDWFLQALTETVLAMTPISMNRLTRPQERFLIESGDFTADELAATQREVDRGSLRLGAAEAWLSNLCATMSLHDVTGFLGWDEETVLSAISEGRKTPVEWLRDGGDVKGVRQIFEALD